MALRRTAEYLLEQEVRTDSSVISSAEELMELIAKAEERIVNLLEGKEHVLDEAPDDEEEAA